LANLPNNAHVNGKIVVDWLIAHGRNSHNIQFADV